MKGFEFCYELEKGDYIPEPDFQPFVWKKPEDGPYDNASDAAEGNGTEGNLKRSMGNNSTSAPPPQQQWGRFL
jgi:hypothetical protein